MSGSWRYANSSTTRRVRALFFSIFTTRSARAPAPTPPAQRDGSSAPPRVAVIDTQHATDGGLQLAAKWAAQRRPPLDVIWWGAATPPPRIAAIAGRLRELGTELAAQFFAGSPQEIDEVLRRTQPEGVIVTVADDAMQIDRVLALTAWLRCPLILLR